MSSQPAAEAPAVDKPTRTAKPAVTKKPAAPRKRTPTAGTSAPRKPRAAPKPKPVEIAAAVAPAVPRRRRLRPVALVALFAIAGVAATLLFLTRQDDTAGQSPGAADAVSVEQLAAFADSRTEPVYWAGRRPGRTLELTSTGAGTFVRYLASGSAVGGLGRSLTVGTYPLARAYATATGRAEAKGMVSRRLDGGGIAVWSSAKPTSVYLAFRGVASLVEVYSPQASEARRLALSGLIRPVR